jgi:hypothetical protein
VRVREGAGRHRTSPDTVIAKSIYQVVKIWHLWHHVMCSLEHILSVPEGDPSKPSNSWGWASHRWANPSIPVPARVGSGTWNVWVQSCPSRLSTCQK